MFKNITVLGIDPGLANCGWSVVEREITDKYKVISCGVIKTSSEKDISSRLYKIFVELKNVISKYKPDVVSIESQFYSRIAKNIINSYLALGIVYLLCGMFNLKVVEYSAKTVKSAITGYGGASKEQLKKMINLLVEKEKIGSEHVNDAIAVAVCYLNTKANL